MSQTTLGTEQTAIATLLSAIGSTQAAMAAAEVDLSYYVGPHFGIAGTADSFFNSVLSPIVIGRLDSEDPMAPSAIIINRTNSASGAQCVQVAFNTAAQVPIFVAASNWIAALSNNQLGALEVAATCKANLLRVSGGKFMQRPTPQVGIDGRGNISAATIQRAAGDANVAGTGTVAPIATQ
jgi:hypothetical protein